MRKHELEKLLYLAVAEALGVTAAAATTRRRPGPAPHRRTGTSRREQRVMEHA